MIFNLDLADLSRAAVRLGYLSADYGARTLKAIDDGSVITVRHLAKAAASTAQLAQRLGQAAIDISDDEILRDLLHITPNDGQAS